MEAGKEMRKTWLAKTFNAGCFECAGGEGQWFAANAQAVAARHHDKTGHATWVDVTLSFTYGERQGPAPVKVASGSLTGKTED